jgi:hypothetical protein
MRTWRGTLLAVAVGSLCPAALWPSVGLAAPPTSLPTPEPVGARNAGLGAVSCPSDTRCVAVGSYQNARHHRLGLIENWDGMRWTIVRDAALPGSQPVFLTSVSCASPRACMAVGIKEPNTHLSGLQPVSERWDGTRWHVAYIAIPRHAAINDLSSVSCSAPASCDAVGNMTRGNRSVALAEHWNGRQWAVAYAGPSVRLGSSTLHRVSCPSPASCVAVGDQRRTRRAEAPLVLHWNGTTWRMISLAISGRSDLLGVSCPNTNACLILGVTARRRYTPIAEQLTGRQLRAVPVSGSGPTDPNVLGSVSCTTITRCLALGSAGATPRNSGQAIAATWDGNAFTTAFTARRAGVSPYWHTSCRPTFCMIVGNHAGRIQTERYDFPTPAQ